MRSFTKVVRCPKPHSLSGWLLRAFGRAIRPCLLPLQVSSLINPLLQSQQPRCSTPASSADSRLQGRFSSTLACCWQVVLIQATEWIKLKEPAERVSFLERLLGTAGKPSVDTMQSLLAHFSGTGNSMFLGHKCQECNAFNHLPHISGLHWYL